MPALLRQVEAAHWDLGHGGPTLLAGVPKQGGRRANSAVACASEVKRGGLS